MMVRAVEDIVVDVRLDVIVLYGLIELICKVYMIGWVFDCGIKKRKGEIEVVRNTYEEELQ